MATRRIADKILDLVTNAQAVAYGDACHVTQSTAPSDVAASASVGSSFDAARTDHAHRGVTDVKNGTTNTQFYGEVTLTAGTGIALSDTGGGGGITIATTGPAVNKNQISLSDNGQYQVAQSDSEVIVAEWNVDASVMAAAAGASQCTPFLSAIVKQSVGTNTAELKLKVGASAPGTNDGTQRAIIAVGNNLTFVQKKDATPPAAFNLGTSDAGAGVLVQLTCKVTGGAAADTMDIRGISVVLSG